MYVLQRAARRQGSSYGNMDLMVKLAGEALEKFIRTDRHEPPMFAT
jgi:hypothetical protein